MTSADKILSIAAGEIGYNRYDDPQPGTKYGRWYSKYTKSPYFGTNGVPFCNMGVSWVFNKAGATILGNGAVYAYVPWMQRDAGKAGRLRGFDDIQPGDVLCFDWDADGESDHTGFAVARDGDYVHTIEFNTSGSHAGSQSDGGGVYRRTRHRSTVSAVIRPAYEAVTPAPAKKFLDIRNIQIALNCVVDNVVGSETRSHLEALKAASAYGGVTFPYGVAFTQKVVRTTIDGIWGSNSEACHDTAVGALQKALNGLGYRLAVDEVYGPETNKAAWDALGKAKQA